MNAHDEGARVRAERFGHLPERPQPETFVVTVPASEDDAPATTPAPPAAAPELVAATQIADADPLRWLRRRR
jgi:hypothetical protein